MAHLTVIITVSVWLCFKLERHCGNIHRHLWSHNCWCSEQQTHFCNNSIQMFCRVLFPILSHSTPLAAPKVNDNSSWHKDSWVIIWVLFFYNGNRKCFRCHSALPHTSQDSGGCVEGHVQINSNHLVITHACLTGALSSSSPSSSGKSVQRCTTMCYYFITIITINDIYDVWHMYYNLA